MEEDFLVDSLLEEQLDLSKDNVPVVGFKGPGGEHGPQILDLKHFRTGVQIMMGNKSQTSPIVKIFERID
jgi:hypothetical protein